MFHFKYKQTMGKFPTSLNTVNATFICKKLSILLLLHKLNLDKNVPVSLLFDFNGGDDGKESSTSSWGSL